MRAPTSIMAPTEKQTRRRLYRATQFFRALLGRIGKEDAEEARRALGPDLYEMFASMPAQYKLHMMAVYRRVRDAGCDDPNVWQAALLHDAGKCDPQSGRYVSLPYRVIIVLLAAFPSGKRLLSRWGDKNMGWRYPLYLHKRHAQLGAQQAAQHGAAPEVVWLIANHHDYTSRDAALTALQAADEVS